MFGLILRHCARALNTIFIIPVQQTTPPSSLRSWAFYSSNIPGACSWPGECCLLASCCSAAQRNAWHEREGVRARGIRGDGVLYSSESRDTNRTSSWGTNKIRSKEAANRRRSWAGQYRRGEGKRRMLPTPTCVLMYNTCILYNTWLGNNNSDNNVKANASNKSNWKPQRSLAHWGKSFVYYILNCLAPSCQMNCFPSLCRFEGTDLCYYKSCRQQIWVAGSAIPYASRVYIKFAMPRLMCLLDKLLRSQLAVCHTHRWVFYAFLYQISSQSQPKHVLRGSQQRCLQKRVNFGWQRHL